MKVYTVHLRRHGLDPERDIVLVAEGFSWPAFILSLVWALWNRMWWVALGLAVVSVAVNGIVWMLGVDQMTAYALSLGVAALTGLLANDLRRWTLEREGFNDCGVVSGGTPDEALARFLEGAPEIAREIV